MCRVELKDEGSSTLLRLCSLLEVVNMTNRVLELGVRPSVRSNAEAQPEPSASESSILRRLTSSLDSRAQAASTNSPKGGEWGGEVEHSLLFSPRRRMAPMVTITPMAQPLRCGETVGVPIDQLGGGLVLRPFERPTKYEWPDNDSVLWMGKLLSEQHSRQGI